MFTPYYINLSKKKLENQPKIIHYFAKEWVKDGHNVLVIYTHPHRLSSLINFIGTIKSLLLLKKPKIKELDGVLSTMIEVYRFSPGDFNHIRIQKKNIYRYCNESIQDWGYEPDKMIYHFPSSYLWLAEKMKNKYNCDQIGVFHNIDLKLISKHKFDYYKKAIQVFSKFGFRSKIIEKNSNFKEVSSDRKFIASSGIPSNIIFKQELSPDFHKKLKIIYVGRLDSNKNVHTILKALDRLNEKINFSFKIFGDGPNRKKLQSFVNNSSLKSKVTFFGEVPRVEIFNAMRDADIFVMVSHKETLGLTYLEAMAAGCIVIGSKGTGIDGIVINDLNGFLVDSHSVEDLTKCIVKISNTDINKLQNILNESYNTILNHTDEHTARSYIENLNT